MNELSYHSMQEDLHPETEEPTRALGRQLLGRPRAGGRISAQRALCV
jgi:hypothetical protein